MPASDTAGLHRATSLVPAFSGLLPHPPIVVPDVGRSRASDCLRTTQACEAFARRLVASEPARLVLVSPHAPRRRHAFGIYGGKVLRGHLGRFDAPRAAVALENDTAVAAALVQEASALGIETWTIPPCELDHGSTVPLWFLTQAGWDGPTVIAALPWGASRVHLERFGSAVALACAAQPGRPAFVASGDMTHRATEDAPGGYDPRGVEFDRELTELVARGHLDRIPDIDVALRECAAEDTTESATIVAAAFGYAGHGAEVLSYEHPFGVGYLVAVFHDGHDGQVAS